MIYFFLEEEMSRVLKKDDNTSRSKAFPQAILKLPCPNAADQSRT